MYTGRHVLSYMLSLYTSRYILSRSLERELPPIYLWKIIYSKVMEPVWDLYLSVNGSPHEGCNL